MNAEDVRMWQGTIREVLACFVGAGLYAWGGWIPVLVFAAWALLFAFVAWRFIKRREALR